MKLSIRLQNHGCANHPYWWIVVAPNRKNIRGRFTQHVGYWCPRERVLIKRQITLNLPRIKHWIARGAVPTPRIHRFLSMFNILPTPWHFSKDHSVNYDDLTQEQRVVQAKKDKRREKDQNGEFNVINYYNSIRKAFTNYHSGSSRKIINAVAVNERENDILREMLLNREFQKIHRVAELTNGPGLNIDQEIIRVRKEAETAKAQLAMLQRIHKNSRPLMQIQVMQKVMNLQLCIETLQRKKPLFKIEQMSIPQDPQINNQQTLQRKIYYELIMKKIIKLDEDMLKYHGMDQIVTREEYANFLFQNKLYEKKIRYQELINKQDKENWNQMNERIKAKFQKNKRSHTKRYDAKSPLDGAKDIQDQTPTEQAATEQAATEQAATEQAPTVQAGSQSTEQTATEQQGAEDTSKSYDESSKWAYEYKSDQDLPDQDGLPSAHFVDIQTFSQQKAQLDQNLQEMLNEEEDPEFVKFLKQEMEKEDAEIALKFCIELAVQEYERLAMVGMTKTRRDLFLEKNLQEELFRQEEMNSFFEDTPDESSPVKKTLYITRDQCIPTLRPVNPFPDLQTYLPTDYYEPLAAYNVMIKTQDTVEPHDQLLKYNQKKAHSGKINPQSKTHDQVIQKYLNKL